MFNRDEQFMARCIDLARQAEGRTSPNPLVGAVVVDDDGNVLGEGYHQKAGEPHAEVFAFNAAGDTARGATLYVSLEPCCHHGKTPPCSDRVIASGVKRVVCGLQDLNPKVAGGGIAALQAAGIDVTVGVLEKECRYLNRAWLKWIQTRKPWVILKIAATLDGKIADRDGRSKWITGETARTFVHDVRNRVDCVMIGGNTAFADDAELTVRHVRGGRDPIRAIVDPQLNLHYESKLAVNPDGKTWVFAKDDAIESKKDLFGANVSLIPTAADGDDASKLDLAWILSYLGEQKVQSIMCEGGSRLFASLLPLADEIYWMVAPKILPDKQAVPSIAGESELCIAHAKRYELHDVTRLGDDVLIKLLL